MVLWWCGTVHAAEVGIDVTDTELATPIQHTTPRTHTHPRIDAHRRTDVSDRREPNPTIVAVAVGVSTHWLATSLAVNVGMSMSSIIAIQS